VLDHRYVDSARWQAQVRRLGPGFPQIAGIESVCASGDDTDWREWFPGSAGCPQVVLASSIPTISKEEQVTKSEFIDQVADRAGLSKKDAADAVDAVLETIEGALKRGSDVTFSGFGKFSVSHRNAREGRNPATGEKINIAASKVPKFTAGAALKKAVN
jgi:DNA-binding protein HU-beta